MADPRDIVQRNPDTDYERTDMPLAPLFWAAVCFLLFIGLAPLVILAGFRGAARDVDRSLTATPPAPRLQTDPEAELRAYLAGAERRRDSYGWVDRSRGIVHVPVDVEMRRLAAEGIPGFPRASPEAPR